MRKTVALASLLLALPATGWSQEMGYGQAEYLNSCGVCHGEQGKGDGPLAAELLTSPTDLTGLARSNGGEFPYWKVFAMIDGRFAVPGHGTREMPVWGRDYLMEDQARLGPIGGEAVTQERIHALADYLATLQR